MRYKGSVYRPPSEAYSLIVQVTYGCSHNTCAFCSMYKEKHFAIRPLEEVLEDFRIARGVYRRVDRVFLADGDALVRKANELYTILDTIRELFPECERVTSYASPASIRIRTEEELRTLRDKGLTMVYMGLESGCDDVLKRMRKGHMSAEIVEMGRKVRRCGMALSVTAITGLGGPELLERHAIETAEAFNAMNPEYIGMLTLMVEPETPLYDWVRDGSFQLLTQPQVLEETRLLMEHLDSPGSVLTQRKNVHNIRQGGHAPHHRCGGARPEPPPAGGVAGPVKPNETAAEQRSAAAFLPGTAGLTAPAGDDTIGPISKRGGMSVLCARPTTGLKRRRHPPVWCCPAPLESPT